MNKERERFIGDLELRHPKDLSGIEIWSIKEKKMLCFFNDKGAKALCEYIGNLYDNKKVVDKMKCECCNDAEVQWELVDAYDKDTTYRVCSNCLPFLTACSLSKLQFKNLLKNGHNANEHLLHEDFYDGDGNSLQGQL